MSLTAKPLGFVGCRRLLACAIGTLDETCDLARSKHQKKGKSNSNQITDIKF
jgi:hypothetical protein